MLKVDIKLFGSPIVKYGGNEIHFSVKKAAALFYFLMVKKEARRDEILNLLWGEHPEAEARKHLRQTVYLLKKAFGFEAVLSPKRELILLNPDVKWTSDLNIFLSSKETSLSSYSGEFLSGFYLKDGETFEHWVRNKRDFYKNIFVSKLYTRIEKNKSRGKWKKVETLARSIINVDEFEEPAFRTLMEFHAHENHFNKAIEVYLRLRDILDKELGITPESKTQQLYNKLIKIRNQTEIGPAEDLDNFFFGRFNELDILGQSLKKFLDGIGREAVFVLGEAGIGKTRLINEFIKQITNDNVHKIETECYLAEEGYLLKPWNHIFTQISTLTKENKISIPLSWQNIIACVFPEFGTGAVKGIMDSMEKLDLLKPKVIEDTIINIIKLISEKRKMILVMEDIQWIDKMSLSLLQSVILDKGCQNIFILGTMRNSYNNDIDNFLSICSRYDRLKTVHIGRFSFDEVKAFAGKALPDVPMTMRFKEKLFRETEGNTFFLVEYLKIVKEQRSIDHLTPRMKDIIKSRIIGVSQQSIKILNIISIFFDEVSLDILSGVSGRDEFDLIEIIEELKERNLIREISDSNGTHYRFTHQKIREFIYHKQSMAARRILHNKIGGLIVKMLVNERMDILLYPKLIYHFTHAQNWVQALRYSLSNANAYLNLRHELFPEFTENGLNKDRFVETTKAMGVKYIGDIESLLEKVKTITITDEEIERLQVEFYHLKGRYLIREGEYDKGIFYINEVIKKAEERDEYPLVFKGYLQIIFYSIQTHNIQLMEENLKFAFTHAEKKNIPKDMATLFRLKGLNLIMKGEYKQAEVLLKKSIDTFSKLDRGSEKYVLCIGAAYNYIGEICRSQNDFSNAMTHYQTAIKLCGDKNIFSSLAIFNTNAGHASFDNGDYPAAEKYLKNALDIFHRFDMVWGRSIAEGFSALLMIREKKYAKALKYLSSADSYSTKIKNPYELGLILRIKTQIRSEMDKNPQLMKVFGGYLSEEMKDYRSRAAEILTGIKREHELELLPN